ncbi:DUF3387 domain-containing protein [candidate division TA06 bacterium]|uniref:DUF3387 domain-containing protein n=1 Tax=candidate division TA06 bacterium TaxID=2250710 RepID=A0A523XNZ6_UNCT6|nr:MAG: DUF3387 domain-containing protein [candidate division TA06 bacterium]
MVVAASRKACVLYKEALDNHLPREYSEIIMTSDRRDEGPLASYVREARQEYEWKEFREIVKDKVEKFREEEFPKILIVTDMLLTGFDAPVLGVMYLDKPLKEHRLLQAIARTNRPYKDLKEAGLILDYVGILKEFQRALEIYSRKDIEHVLWDVNGLRRDFLGLLKDLRSLFGDLAMSYERDTLLKAVEILTSDPQREEDFVTAYRSMRKLFELLGPDVIKLEHFEAFKWFSAIYTYYMKVVNDRPAVESWVQKFCDKTIRLIHKTTEIEEIERDLPTLSIDAESLRRLEQRIKSQKEKAASILFTLQRFVLVERGKNPIYETLSDRVQKLFELWREKTKDYQRIYSDASNLFQEVVALTDRQKALGFSRMEYGMLLTLEHEFGQNRAFVEDVRSLCAQLAKHLFPSWDIQTTVRKEVERVVRRFARSLKVSYNLTLERMDTIYKKLIEQVKNYDLPGHSL